MFSNSEPYGCNEGQSSMLAQVAISQIARTDSNGLNFNIMDKQSSVSQKNHDQFNVQAYSEFGQVPMSFESPKSPFSTPNSDGSNDGAPETMHPGINFVAVDVPKFDTETETPENEDTLQENFIEVKLEPASWADTDYQQPFCRDANGVSSMNRDDSWNIYSESSVEKAKECIENGHNPQGYFECPSCTLLLQHPKRFLIHVKWHSFGLTYKRRMDEMKEQQMMKDERRKARNEEKAKLDEAKESPDGEFPCKDCDKIFVVRGGLKKHRAKCHPVQMSECKVCLAPVKGLAGFRAHMATHTSKERETHRYQCPECPKKYKFSHSLYKHIDTHLEKTHKCEVCTKMFGSAAQLGRHMKSHEKVARGAQFHCAFCGKGYYDTFTLQIHERIHTNERPFKCEICKTSFQTNSSLKRHTRISHNTNAPHQCDTCKRSFNSEKVLERHILRAHSDPENFQYPCAMCEKRYFKPKDLRNHMYKVHARKMRDPPSETD